VDTLSAPLMSRFEFVRTDAAQEAVSSRAIVKGLVNVFLDAFLLQGAEEELRHGIVPAIAFSTHARLEVIRSTKSPPGVTPILRPLIRMHHGVTRPATAYRHRDGIEHDLAVDRRAGCPADDFPGEKVHDHCEIQPPLPRANVGDICDPDCVGTRHSELALQ